MQRTRQRKVKTFLCNFRGKVHDRRSGWFIGFQLFLLSWAWRTRDNSLTPLESFLNAIVDDCEWLWTIWIRDCESRVSWPWAPRRSQAQAHGLKNDSYLTTDKNCNNSEVQNRLGCSFVSSSLKRRICNQSDGYSNMSFWWSLQREVVWKNPFDLSDSRFYTLETKIWIYALETLSGRLATTIIIIVIAREIIPNMWITYLSALCYQLCLQCRFCNQWMRLMQRSRFTKFFLSLIPQYSNFYFSRVHNA